METKTKNQTAEQNLGVETKQAPILSLEEMKEYFRQKEQRIKLLDAIEENIDKLAGIQAENAEREEHTDYFSEPKPSYKITLEGENDYGRAETLFKVTNPMLVGEVMALLIKKMIAKAEVLKAEIMA